MLTEVTEGGETRALALANELDLSLSQMRALLVMRQARDPVSLGELARGIGLSDAATVRIVDRLISAGLSDRREDAHDRRIKRISLSDRGRHTVDRLVDAKHERLKRLTETLTPEEQNRLAEALKPISDRLGPILEARS